MAEILPVHAATGVIPVFAEKRLSRKRSDPPPQRTRTPAVFRAGKKPARTCGKLPSVQKKNTPAGIRKESCRR